MEHYLHQIYFGNTVKQYLTVLGLIVVSLLLITLFHKIVLSRLKVWAAKTKNKLDDSLIEIIYQYILPLTKIVAIYIFLQGLTLSAWTDTLLKNGLTTVITFYVIKIIIRFIKSLLEAFIKKQENAEGKMKQLRGILIVIKITVWTTGLIFLFDNLGYDVTAVITGMGIGGLAVALAAQAVLGDLFSYFVVFFDKPFEIGDFIIVDDKVGNIEYIGIKTTRIKSLSGEQIVISNSDLTSSRLRNYKRMKKRRVSFSLGVTYQTTPSQLKTIPAIVNDIVAKEQDTEVGRCHFFSYGDFSLNFEVVYFVTNPEYDRYMDIQQAINLAIFEAFAEQKIEFAYPTQTLFVDKSA